MVLYSPLSAPLLKNCFIFKVRTCNLHITFEALCQAQFNLGRAAPFCFDIGTHNPWPQQQCTHRQVSDTYSMHKGRSSRMFLSGPNGVWRGQNWNFLKKSIFPTHHHRYYLAMLKNAHHFEMAKWCLKLGNKYTLVFSISTYLSSYCDLNLEPKHCSIVLVCSVNGLLVDNWTGPKFIVKFQLQHIHKLSRPQTPSHPQTHHKISTSLFIAHRIPANGLIMT